PRKDGDRGVRATRGSAAGPGLRDNRVRHERRAPGGARRRRAHRDGTALRHAARTAAADEGRAGRTAGHARRSAGAEHSSVGGPKARRTATPMAKSRWTILTYIAAH